MLVVLMVLVVLVVLLVLVVLVVLVALVVLVVLNLESGCGDCHGFLFFLFSISQSQIFKTYSLTPCPTRSTPHQPNTQQQNRTKKNIERTNLSPPTRGFPNTSKRGDLL